MFKTLLVLFLSFQLTIQASENISPNTLNGNQSSYAVSEKLKDKYFESAKLIFSTFMISVLTFSNQTKTCERTSMRTASYVAALLSTTIFIIGYAVLAFSTMVEQGVKGSYDHEIELKLIKNKRLFAESIRGLVSTYASGMTIALLLALLEMKYEGSFITLNLQKNKFFSFFITQIKKVLLNDTYAEAFDPEGPDLGIAMLIGGHSVMVISKAIDIYKTNKIRNSTSCQISVGSYAFRISIYITLVAMGWAALDANEKLVDEIKNQENNINSIINTTNSTIKK